MLSIKFPRVSNLLLVSLLLSSIPSQVLAISYLDNNAITAEVESPFTDVDFPKMPHESEYSSENEFLAAKEKYYQSFGALLFSMQLANGFNYSKLVGYEAEDGTHYFAPDNTVNRAEAAKFFAVYSRLGTIYVNNGVATTGDSFVDELPDWAADYIWVLKEISINLSQPGRLLKSLLEIQKWHHQNYPPNLKAGV